MSKILVVGDLHFKDSLSYDEYIKGGRTSEKEEILNFIVSQSSDCASVVFMGDNFDHRNNTAEVVRDFVNFITRFGSEKEIFIISGNHEKKGNGTTAVDFMGAMMIPNWHIFTTFGKGNAYGIKADFLPYTLKSELGVETNQEASDKLNSLLQGNRILFHHHMMDELINGIDVKLVNEPILNVSKLKKKYDLVLGGHIHGTEQKGNCIVTGSVFNGQVGDNGKFIWKINDSDLSVEKISLPGRKIYSFTNPTSEELSKIDTSSIVKVFITKNEVGLDSLGEFLEKFDAHLVIEKYDNKREKAHFEEGALDLDTVKLLGIYAEQKKIELNNLMKGWELIQ